LTIKALSIIWDTMRAEVVKLVDAADSKSAELRLMPVRFRPSAPIIQKERHPILVHSGSYTTKRDLRNRKEVFSFLLRCLYHINLNPVCLVCRAEQYEIRRSNV
jgi:hypothetical protein